MNRPVPFRRRLAGAAALSLSSVVIAQPDDAVSLSLPAAPLGDALRAFSVQAGVPVIFTEALVSGRSSRAVKDSANAEAALGALLDGTGLEAVAGAGGYVIRQKAGKPERVPENAGALAPVPEPVPSRPDTRVEDVSAPPANNPRTGTNVAAFIWTCEWTYKICRVTSGIVMSG